MVRYYRKVLKITGSDSPNVRFALLQQARGIQPTGEVLVPGVLTWEEYQKRLATWEKIRITIGILDEFYLGAEVMLFPPDWLDRANRLAEGLNGKVRHAQAIGIDPAEGGDRT